MIKHDGFTLIELMVTLAVLAIVLAIAAPTFTDIIRNNKVQTESNRLVTALKEARTEAIRRSKYVAACFSTDGASCSSTGTTILVFQDGATSDTGTPSIVTSNILRKLTGNASDITRTTSNSLTYFRFNNLGRLVNLANDATITLKHSECSTGQTNARQIQLKKDGHATIVKTNC